VKAFDGAMNVLMMRAPSESGAGWEVGVETGELGKTGAAIDVSFEVRWDSSRARGMETSNDEGTISACRT
jgi:hypothetical protein